MEPHTIEGSVRHPLLFGVGIVVFGVPLIAALMAWDHLLVGTWPADYEYWAIFVLPLVIAIVWLLMVWRARATSARMVSIDANEIRISRFSGLQEQIDWASVESVEYYADDDSIVCLITAEQSYEINGHAFGQRDWERFHKAFLSNLPEHVEPVGLLAYDGRSLTTWCNRGAVTLLFVWIVAVVGLLAWNPRNAAWAIVLTLMPVAFVYLGQVTPYVERGLVPIAKTIGFYAFKSYITVPIGVLWYCFFTDAGRAKIAQLGWLYVAANVLMFGSMLIVLLCLGGWSSKQYWKNDLRGINRYSGRVSAVFGVLVVLGLLMKMFVEG